MDDAPQQHPPKAVGYKFGGFVLDASRGVLLWPDGTEVGLRPKSAEVLCHLARSPGQVVSRDDLMEAIWPGVIVTDDSITQCIAEARRALGEAGAPLLRTLPRRGYLLAAEVTCGEPLRPAITLPAAAVAAPAATATGRTGAASPPTVRSWRFAWVPELIVVAAALVGIAGWWSLPGRPPHPITAPAPEATAAAGEAATLPPPPAQPAAMPARRLSMAVMPFANLDGDSEHDRLADAVTQKIATGLSRSDGFSVVGRGALAAYRDRAADVRRLGTELGVRYVVDGNLRRLGEQVSVDIQLHDTAAGTLLWADHFDLPRAEPAGLPRLVHARVSRPLWFRIMTIEGERSRAERPDAPDALDFLLRGHEVWGGTVSRENNAEARRLFERAVALDAGLAGAHAALGGTLVDSVALSWSEDRTPDLARGERHLARALILQPDHGSAHFWSGVAHGVHWRFDEALVEFDRLIAADVMVGHAQHLRGWMMLYTDRPAEAAASAGEALRLSPREPRSASLHHLLGWASQMLGRDEEALGQFMRAASARPSSDLIQLSLATAYALLGREKEAQAVLRVVRARRPDITLGRIVASAALSSPYPLFSATVTRRLDGLRLAGLPED